jgi:hypothetical protein
MTLNWDCCMLANNSVGLMGGLSVHKIHTGKNDEHGLILLLDILPTTPFSSLNVCEHRL